MYYLLVCIELIQYFSILNFDFTYEIRVSAQ